MDHPVAPCRIFCLIAREANQAVVFRRGPSRRFQILLWDLKTNVITQGQWLHSHIYTQYCDVSPDGKYLVIAAANHNYRRAMRSDSQVDTSDVRSWTALSRPPYLTALALWESRLNYNKCGIWVSNEELCFDFEPELIKGNLPNKLSTRSTKSVDRTTRSIINGWDYVGIRGAIPSPELDERGRAVNQMAKSGPKLLAFEAFREKAYADLGIRRSYHPGFILRKSVRGGSILYYSSFYQRKSYDEKLELVDQDGLAISAPFKVTWADCDSKMKLLLAGNGCLWAWSSFPKGEPELVADLTPNTHENVKAPDWALQW